MDASNGRVDSLFMDKVRQARCMSDADKLWTGPREFDRICRWMAAGIRDEFPDADEHAVQRMLGERLALWRRLEATR